MSGGGEYEPMDSRKATGTAGNPNKSWREQEDAWAGRGEYEPKDQRNVTGQPAEQVDRWKKDDTDPPKASGEAAVGVRSLEDERVNPGADSTAGNDAGGARTEHDKAAQDDTFFRENHVQTGTQRDPPASPGRSIAARAGLLMGGAPAMGLRAP